MTTEVSVKLFYYFIQWKSGRKGEEIPVRERLVGMMWPVFPCMKCSQRQRVRVKGKPVGRGKAHQVGEGWYYQGCKVWGRKYSGRERWWKPNLEMTLWNTSGIKFCLIFRIKDVSTDEAGINTKRVFSCKTRYTQYLNTWFFWKLPHPLSHQKHIKYKDC